MNTATINVIARRNAPKQSRIFAAILDCFACARNDGAGRWYEPSLATTAESAI
jgi:hypothetical protein